MSLTTVIYPVYFIFSLALEIALFVLAIKILQDPASTTTSKTVAWILIVLCSIFFLIVIAGIIGGVYLWKTDKYLEYM